MIQVDRLTKYYGSYIGVEDVSFKVDKGEVVGFIGPNGAGKTTTMRILTGAMSATSGDATVAGFDVLNASMEVRRRVGYLPESPPVYPEMTVDAYLRFVGRIKRVERRRLAERIERVTETCGLGHMRRRVIGQLSKGYRQRVGIAQALIHEPGVLIFDEPTSGLDPGQIVEIRKLLRELGQGEGAVILSTHILAEAQMTCRRLLIINQGRIAGDVQLDESGEALAFRSATGEATEYGSTRNARVVARHGDNALTMALKRIEGVASVDVFTDGDSTEWRIAAPVEKDLRAEIAAIVVNSGAELLELREDRPSLERIFLDLTQTRHDTEGDAR